MYSSMMTPVCTVTPNNARNPTPDETLKLVWVISNARSPPMGAIARFVRMSSAHLTDLNIAYRMMKIIRMVIGSTSARRRWERFWLSYSPAQSMVYPVGNWTAALTFVIASWTVLPKSRSLTLYLTATYRELA